MGPSFWQHVKRESDATHRLLSSKCGSKLHDMHLELLKIDQEAQVLTAFSAIKE